MTTYQTYYNNICSSPNFIESLSEKDIGQELDEALHIIFFNGCIHSDGGLIFSGGDNDDIICPICNKPITPTPMYSFSMRDASILVKNVMDLFLTRKKNYYAELVVNDFGVINKTYTFLNIDNNFIKHITYVHKIAVFDNMSVIMAFDELKDGIRDKTTSFHSLSPTKKELPLTVCKICLKVAKEVFGICGDLDLKTDDMIMPAITNFIISNNTHRFRFLDID